jgi:hypothetical protein
MSEMVHRISGDGHHIHFDDVAPTMAKANLKKVDDATGRARWGEILRRAVELSGLIEKEAAERLKVDRAQFSRWLSGHENAHTWKFHIDELLGPALIAAQAEVTLGATIRTVIELERKVG